MEEFLTALQLSINPENNEAEQRIVEIRDQDPILFLQYIQETILSDNVNDRVKMYAIVYARTVFPSKIPLHGDPIAEYPPEFISSFLNTLFQLFSHPVDDIRYHSANTYGRIAMFQLNSDPNSTHITELSGAFADGSDVNIISCCAIALGQIVLQLHLSLNQYETIYVPIFGYLNHPEGSYFVKGICLTILLTFSNELPDLIRDTQQIFAEMLQSLSEIPVFSDHCFLLWSYLAQKCYSIIQYAPNLIDISYNSLINPKSTKDLKLNILRFWTLVSQKEIINDNSLNLTAQASPRLLLLFLQILDEQKVEYFPPEEEWDLFNACFYVIIAFFQADPENCYQIVTTNELGVISTYQSIYSLLVCGNQQAIQNSIQSAFDMISQSLYDQNSSHVITNFSLLILEELIKYIQVPFDYVSICLNLIGTNDQVLCNSVLPILQDSVQIYDVGQMINNLSSIIIDVTQSISAITAMRLISHLVQYLENTSEILQHLISYAENLLQNHPDNECISEVFMTIISIIRKDKEVSDEVLLSIYQLAVGAQSTANRSSALKVIGIIVVLLDKKFADYLNDLMSIIFQRLQERDNAYDIVSAFQCISIISRRFNIEEYVPTILEHSFSLMSDPDFSDSVTSAAIDSLSSIAYYFPNAVLPYAYNLAEYISSAADVMMQASEEEDLSLSFISAVTECSGLLLKYDDSELKLHTVPLAMKVVLEIPKLGQSYSKSLIYGFLDILFMISDSIPKSDFIQFVSNEGIHRLVILCCEHENERIKNDASALIQMIQASD